MRAPDAASRSSGAVQGARRLHVLGTETCSDTSRSWRGRVDPSAQFMLGGARLGILLLETGNPDLPGTLADPRSFRYPVLLRKVKRASTQAVLDAKPQAGIEFVRAAVALEAAGAAAVVTNCGYAVVYQRAIQRAVSVPVAASSLLLLPAIMQSVGPGATVGILAYDATRLGLRHLRAAGVHASERIVTVGIEGTRSWQALAARRPQLTMRQLRQDVGAAARRLLAAHPAISAVLLECSVFCATADWLRRRTPFPLWDYRALCDGIWAQATARTEARGPVAGTGGRAREKDAEGLPCPETPPLGLALRRGPI